MQTDWTMPLTLGLTGMDPDTESALTAALNAANARLGSPCELMSEKDADYVIVDMDSMYGPMSWLRLHAAQKQVIGLTTASRTQTDFRLERPFDADSVGLLLKSLADAAGMPLGGGTATQDAPPPPAVAPAPVAAAPQTQAAPAETGLAQWLAKDRLKGRVRFERGGQRVLIDATSRQYLAGSALKPLAPLFEGGVSEGDFTPVDAAAWDSAAGAGEPQPLVRLVWLGGLLAGRGRILDGYDADGRFHMIKWPQTEREYPKHFRISTVMMKGPATLAEIAGASGVPEADVADFINANLATGFAEQYREPEPETEPPKSGLFGRLRGR